MAVSDPRKREPDMFMSICGFAGEPDKSFEELRIEDYLRAYATTGQPPQPCPPTPVDPVARANLGLPPLWKPRLAVEPVDLKKLPDTQVFSPTTEDGQIMHNIVCLETYSKFSHEELRYEAYRRGHKMLPTPITMISSSVTTPISRHRSRHDSWQAAKTYATDKSDLLQTISASTQYKQHSLEELRIASMRAGRDLSSNEISALQSPSTPAPAPTPGPVYPALRQAGAPLLPNISMTPSTPHAGSPYQLFEPRQFRF